jgi:hypothetical protein
MGMLSRLRAISLSGSLPSRKRAWFEFTLEAAAEPEAGGDRVRLQARTSLNLPGRALRSFFELRGSTAPLDEGSHALVPERLDALGIEPVAGRKLQTWAGAVPGPRPGFAVLSLVQLDKGPVHVAATVANVVEQT